MTPEFYLYLALCAAVGLYLIPSGIRVTREELEAFRSHREALESTEGPCA